MPLVGKIDHGDTERTEQRRMARIARPTPLLRGLRASVVNPMGDFRRLNRAGDYFAGCTGDQSFTLDVFS